MNDHSVIVVGAGPTGLMLAGELAVAGVDVAILERRPGQEVVGTRARGVNARTIELFEQRGIAERFLSQGQTFSSVAFAWIRLNIDDLPSRHPYGLALAQGEIERILADWVEELGVPILRGREVRGLSQGAPGVVAELADGSSLSADYLVGCDGGRSLVRKAAGIPFPGSEPTISNLIAEVEISEEPPWGLRHDALGVHSIARSEGSRFVQILVTEQDLGDRTAPALTALSRALIAVYGSDFGAHSPVFVSRFTDATRQASSYRQGRILIAGDAAHIHYPAGGQGLNLGLQDAVNLGWKLAQVVQRVSPESLLDSYEAEQHPVAARILQMTMAQAALLGRLDDHKSALREIVSELLASDGPRRQFGAMLSGLDVHYDLGSGHPLLGRRMPDLDLVTSNGRRRVSGLLHEGRPVLLNFGRPGRFDGIARSSRLKIIDAEPVGRWEIPAIGAVRGSTAILIRPDGMVAWIDFPDCEDLADSLARWIEPALSSAEQSLSLQ